MKTTDELFLLIKSLKQTEKRYFKIYASKHVIGEKNNYVRLFEAIDKQKEYDEETIRKKFPNSNFLKQLHVAKNYLYKLILKSLRNYHSELSSVSEIKNVLRDVEILYEKALYKQCRKLLLKIKKAAYVHEDHLQILEIIKWDKKIINAEFHIGKHDKILEKVIEEEQVVLEKLGNTIDYWKLQSTMSKLIQKEGLPRNQDELEKFNKINDSPLLHNDAFALSFQSKLYFYNISADYSYVKGDLENDYKFSEKVLGLIESNFEKISGETHIYIEALHNYLIASNRIKKYDDFKEALKKLRNIPKNEFFGESEDALVRIFVFSYSMELKMYLNTGEFVKGVMLIPEIESGLDRFKGKINRVHEIVFYYNIAYMYMGAGEYNKSLSWLNKILNSTDIDVRQDILSFARILNLVIHYELGNDDVLEYTVKSTYRYLYARKRLYKFETILLNFIRKLPKNSSPVKLLNSFSDLREALLNISENTFEKKALEYFDLISWLESKINKTSYAEVIKSKGK
jgi:hypothetical protein